METSLGRAEVEGCVVVAGAARRAAERVIARRPTPWPLSRAAAAAAPRLVLPRGRARCNADIPAPRLGAKERAGARSWRHGGGGGRGTDSGKRETGALAGAALPPPSPPAFPSPPAPGVQGDACEPDPARALRSRQLAGPVGSKTSRAGDRRPRPPPPLFSLSPRRSRSPPLPLSLLQGYIGEFEFVDDHRAGKIVVELNGR